MLFVVTATRGRPQEVYCQAALVAAQLGRDDAWCVSEDVCAPETRIDWRQLRDAFRSKAQLLTISRGSVKTDLGPNASKRLGCALAPAGSWIVELDDHDLLMPGALDAVRDAAADASVLYGWSYLNRRGSITMDVRRPYERWGFRTHPRGFPCAGLRAYREDLYRYAGGWPVGWPCGDAELMLRMETALGGRQIHCIEQALVMRGGTRDLEYRRLQSYRATKLVFAAREELEFRNSAEGRDWLSSSDGEDYQWMRESSGGGVRR